MNSLGCDRSDLHRLQVIDRIEIGPTKLESQRMSTPYRVIQGKDSNIIDFVYRFEENVFAPKDPADQNLAALMGVQLACNYGLFCKEIVFQDAFDTNDIAFISEIIEATAQEIYAVKLLQPNPFLVGWASELKPQVQESYLQAQLFFPNQLIDNQASCWQTDPTRVAVLSSGGKESLLSFGLLQESGLEVHPLFVNESGRHWLTALHAYRDFKKRYSQTARVWTNSDRVFNWMLRRLPFVRKDFSSLRSDEYPIRLWTVALFVFGVLPLLKKRNLSALIIGNEHDTTVQSNLLGIKHYHGLYDQSRYFDQQLTEYFVRKGFGLHQFSILRSMSELLVEKTLFERYPELAKLQTSCHATHHDQDRIRPCGKCEKCRRVVAMLVALNQDPTIIGYTSGQIQDCIKAVEQRGVHQELVGAQHLAYQLFEKKQIREPKLGSVLAENKIETMQLRFHPDRSPLNVVPQAIQESVSRILLEHSLGAVRCMESAWEPFDLLRDPGLHQSNLV